MTQPITLAEALAGDTATPLLTGRRCKFGRLLDSVSVEVAEDLTERLAVGSGWNDGKLARLISSTDAGSISAWSLSTHRQGACCCDSPTIERLAA